MAEIASLISFFLHLALRKILTFGRYPVLFSGLSSARICQQQKPGKKMIEVLNADEGIDEIEKTTGKRLTRLLGNVSLKQDDIFMTCDSAWFYTGFNQVKAYSRIHMYQGDTLHLYGDSLFYDGASETCIG